MKSLFFLIILLLSGCIMNAQDLYHLGPNSRTYENIPAGTITQHTWESKIFPNTIRDYWVYVPAQYDGSKPAALMVFQDGHAYLAEDSYFRTTRVFDNLISQGKMPVTIGLFINPGTDKDAPAPESAWRATNRSVEYDEVTDTYVRFLLEEMIPELEKNYSISDDPEMRAIGGLSSGAICAFSAAWFRPDEFRKVLSHIGSYTNIRGGHAYPSMIRQKDKKDIKVFLQDGENDLDNQYGNWWLANLQMEAALKYKDYKYKFVPGEGGHNGEQGGAILPESLIWLWDDAVPHKVGSGVYPLSEGLGNEVLMSGPTMHFSDMTFQFKTLLQNEGSLDLQQDLEQIIILKEGRATVAIGNETKTIGPNSVAFLLPGEQGTITSETAKTKYYTMVYGAAQAPDPERGKQDGGSFIIDFNDPEYREHDKGGVRSFFRRSTAMCSYYEMHVSNLNPGIKMHEPHVHDAAEIILMIDGETEMEVGNEVYNAKKGDVYFLASNVPHAIKNIGEKQCQYFAFQWAY